MKTSHEFELQEELRASAPAKSAPRKSGRARSIRSRIFGYFLLITLLPIIGIGFYSYYSFRQTLTQKIAQYSLENLTPTVVNIQLKLTEFENISVRLFINKEFNNALSGYIAAQDAALAAQAKGEIESYFNEYMIVNKDLYAFMFIPDAGPPLVVCKDDYPDFLDLTHRFKETSPYRNIRKAGGGIVWSSSIKLHLSHYVVLGRQINKMGTGESLGVLAIFVDEEQIDQLANLNVYKQLNISFGDLENYDLIIDSNGEIVSTPFKNDIGANVSKIMKDAKPLGKILENTVSDRDYGAEINQGSFITEVNRKQTLVTYKTIGSKIGVGGKSGWHLLNFTPTSHIYAKPNEVGYVTIILGVMTAIFTLVGVGFSIRLCERNIHKHTNNS